MKKLILLSSLLSSFLFAKDLEYKGNIGIESAYLKHDIANKRDHQNTLHAELELKKKVQNGQFVLNVESIVDVDDKKRRYIDVNDLYYKHNFENSDLLIGRNTRFWGAMEFYNHTDAFNTKDLRDDPFDYDSKIGSNNIAYTQYFENSELALIAKVGQERQRVQGIQSVYNFLPPNYNDSLITQKDKNRPSIYLKYSGSGEETQVDYAFIYENGYDEQRYLAPEGTGLQQHAYIVDKFMTYATLVSGDTIYKTELAYTKSQDEIVSDYAQLSVGLEHTLYGILDRTDLGLLLEYYRYEAQDDSKLGAKDFGNLFQDDVTLGFRWTLNDGADSDILGGLAIDNDNHEKIFFIEYETRLMDKYKLAISYQHLIPKSSSTFQKLDSAKVEFGYYF